MMIRLDTDEGLTKVRDAFNLNLLASPFSSRDLVVY